MSKKPVSDFLKQGNTYAANQEWTSAAIEFMKALDKLYGACTPSQPSPSQCAADLYTALEAHVEDPEDPNEDPVGPVAPAPAKLLELMIQGFAKMRDGTSDPVEAKCFRFNGFLEPCSPVWTIVFVRSSKEKKYGTLRVSIPVKSATLIVGKENAQWLEQPIAAQIAYAWAHRAEALVNQTKAMYSLDQVLLAEAVPALDLRKEDYLRALLIDPDRFWTLAHLGEVYRDMANSVPGLMDYLFPEKGNKREQRLENYACAIIYYRESIDRAISKNMRPSPWAYAHLGAAVVNTRAFVEFDGDRNTDLLQKGLLADLLVDWPAEWPEETTAAATAADAVNHTNLRFTNRAMMALVRAQELQGFYYPWAQGYYGGTLLLKSIFSKDQVGQLNAALAQIAQLQTALVYYLQPALLGAVFEPTRLDVNPMFEMAAIQHHVNEYELAWCYAWMGMHWLFRDKFQPGLYGLTGYGLLVTIAYRAGNSGGSPRGLSDAMITQAMLNNRSADINKIPRALPKNWGNMGPFIHQLIEDACSKQIEPHLRFWLRKENRDNLDSDVLLGLQTTLRIMWDFVGVLETYGNAELNERLQKFCAKIRGALKSRHPDIATFAVDPPPLTNNLFASLNLDAPSYFDYPTIRKGAQQ
jgi:hypothetical protein